MRRYFLVIIILCSSAPAWCQLCNCFLTVDSSYQIVPMPLGPDPGAAPLYQCGYCSSAAIPLPFNFCFYGKNYDTVYINNKGSLSFGRPVYNYTNVGLPQGPDTATLDVFLADVYDSLTPGEVYYKITPTHLIVQWNTVGYQTFDCDLYDNFQVIITNGADSILKMGNNVSYCYELMRWASGDSAGGSGGFFGVPAEAGISKGDGIHYAQFITTSLHGYTYYGPYDSLSELYWMDYKSFTFNTCVTRDTIPPVMVTSDSCNYDTICVGDTVSFGATFLCPHAGQKAKLSVSSPGISGFITDTVSGNSMFHANIKLATVIADTGTHIITVTATDNSTPPLTNAKEYTVVIKNCSDTTIGINELKKNPEPVIYPNPSSGVFTIQLSVARPQLSVGVYNVLGEKVYSRFLIPDSPLRIDLSSQPSGVYFCRLISNNGNLIGEGKLVIGK